MLVSKKNCKFPKRKLTSHKGDSGRVLIIGGSEEFVGAPILAAIAAFKAGVDLVEVVAPQKVAWAINTYNPNIITHKLKCKEFSSAQIPAIMKFVNKADAVLIGNGIGRSKQKLSFMRTLLEKIKKPLVIDADALHAVNIEKLKTNFICTPHHREYEVMRANCKYPEKYLSEEKIILLKGNKDKILTGKKIYINETGVPEMTVGGTGDILAGLCVGFLAQKLSPLQAAINSAWLCGKTGEKAKKKYGNFTATELLYFI